jgi:hypothetical protein
MENFAEEKDKWERNDVRPFLMANSIETLGIVVPSSADMAVNTPPVQVAPFPVRTRGNKKLAKFLSQVKKDIFKKRKF